MKALYTLIILFFPFFLKAQLDSAYVTKGIEKAFDFYINNINCFNENDNFDVQCFDSLIYENQNITSLTIDLTLNPFFNPPIGQSYLTAEYYSSKIYDYNNGQYLYYGDGSLLFNLNFFSYLYLCPNLENLQIIGHDFNTQYNNFVIDLSQLENLKSIYIEQLNISSIYLNENINLEEITLKNSPISVVYLDDLEKVNNIEFHNISINNFSYENNLNVLDIKYNNNLLNIDLTADTINNLMLEYNNYLNFAEINLNFNEQARVKNNENFNEIYFNSESGTSFIDFSNNNLEFINLSESSLEELNHLDLSNNNLSSFDLSEFSLVELDHLNLSNNNLNTLTLSDSLPLLTFLDVSNNNITNFNLNISPELSFLDLSSNNISILNLEGFLNLNYIYLNDNLLESLNLSNTSFFNYQYSFNATNNNLSCINVDDISWFSSNLTYLQGEIDQYVIFDNDCYEINGCTDFNAVNFNSNASVDDGSCIFIYGCTDISALNYNDNAGIEDGSCLYAEDPCDIVPSGLSVNNIIHNRITFNWSAPSAAPSHYMIRYRVVGTSSWTVMTAGPVNSNDFNGTSRTRYFMEPGTTYEWSMRARVLNEDGSINCQSSWSANSEYTTLPACANLENLSVDNVEANWVTFNADAPAAEWGVWQSKGKIREAGSNAYRYVNGDSDGTISGVLKGNFTASTDYEWHTKSWCTGNVDDVGNPDPKYHSGWGEFSAFSTEAPCDKMPTNLTTTSNGANTAVIMSWDTPAPGAPDHYFLEMTNLTTGAVYEWNYQDGNSNSRTKFGQNPGDEISWRIRGACGANGTSWATPFTDYEYYTLGGERLGNEIVSGLNINIYPNPSSNTFNTEYYSEKVSEVIVTNILGEQVYFESIKSIGDISTKIDLSNYSKGIYNLTIKTSEGISNHKLILQ